jgi:leucyl-tRNA---protein transferase
LCASWFDAATYQALMDLGFRRSGKLVYRPACEGCRECVPIRVPVDRFRLSRSQRRVWRRNQDVHVAVGEPRSSDEKWRMYVEYLRQRHDGTMSESREDFQEFLYAAVTDTLEMVYRAGDRIVAVGIVDACPGCLSSVYFYFGPAQSRRSLGTFGALCEIAECRRRGLAYWYAGYYVRECAAMNYKADFRPYELLGPDGLWRAAEAR